MIDVHSLATTKKPKSYGLAHRLDSLLLDAPDAYSPEQYQGFLRICADYIKATKPECRSLELIFWQTLAIGLMLSMVARHFGWWFW